MKLAQILEAITKDQILRTYQRNPKFFNTPQNFKLGVVGGIFDFTLELDPDDVQRYIDGDWTISRYTTKEGRKVEVGFFETILSGDAWDLWNRDGYDGDWEGVLDYHINQENENEIKNIINKLIIKNGRDPEEFTDNSLQDLINDFDDDYYIRNAMSSALSDVESDEYVDYLRGQLKSACEDYGEVTKFGDEGVHIKIDFKYFIENTFGKDFADDEEVIEMMEDRCGWDPECFFTEVSDPYTEKPSFKADDRWHPSVDDNNFNLMLKDRLSEVPYEYGLE
jgi:hypothetical protein